MEKYFVDTTSRSPSILFDPDKGILEIKGRSIPENSVEFYLPLLEMLSAHSEKGKAITSVTMHFLYFSTSSSKCILEIFRLLEIIYKNGHSFRINWLYEQGDEEILDAGEDFQVIVNIPFTFVPVKE